MLSPHETLKVAPDATAEEIQQAYRSWIKLVHPDRVEPSLKGFANSLTQDINNAYAALTSGRKTAAPSSQNSLEKYLNFIRESSEVSQDGKGERIALPYWSLPATALVFEDKTDEPFLNLYIRQKAKSGFVITDRGENLKCLADMGHPSDLESVKKNIDENRFPVTVKRNALSVDSEDCPSLGEAIDCMVKTIIDIDSEYNSRIHNWYKDQDFLRQRNQVALICGELDDADYNRGMVFQSSPFQMTRKGQRLHVLLIADPIWDQGEIKLTRLDDPIMSKNTTIFESSGSLRYQDEFTATDESYKVPEVDKWYRLTVSGRGGFVLAAYKTM